MYIGLMGLRAGIVRIAACEGWEILKWLPPLGLRMLSPKAHDMTSISAITNPPCGLFAMLLKSLSLFDMGTLSSLENLTRHRLHADSRLAATHATLRLARGCDAIVCPPVANYVTAGETSPV
jgi:hypothetical protein